MGGSVDIHNGIGHMRESESELTMGAREVSQGKLP